MYVIVNCDCQTIYTPVIKDNLGKAIEYCRENIVEDFGCKDIFELRENYEVREEADKKKLRYGAVYELDCSNGDGRMDMYRVFCI